MIKYILLIAVILFTTGCSTMLKTQQPMTFSTATRSPEPGTFAFDIPVVIKLDSVKTELQQNFSELTVSGVKIKLNDVKIYGANSSQLVIGLNVDATKGWFKVNGWIYLRATPDLDVENQIFRVKDVQLDAQTKQVLLNGTAWLINPILKAVSNNIKIDISKLVADKKKMLENFEIPGYGLMNLDIKEFQVKEIDVTDTELEVRIKTSGIIAVKVDIK